MGKRNVTIQLDEEIARKARVLAAQRATSLSRMVAEQLEQVVRSDVAYQAAKRKALRRMSQGYHLGGQRMKRETLYER